MTIQLRYFAVTLVLFAALSCSLERTAHAYVDPGSSLLVFQSLSAVVTGALFYFRRRLKTLFQRRPSAPIAAATAVAAKETNGWS